GNDSQEINVYPKTFKIAHYSNSRLQGDKNIFCEGRTDDIALAKNGKNLHFNDYAIDPSQEDGPPKMVALNRIYGATGCT
ncbi:hypothetical protein, partial [Shewanella algae]|uniref:hypothetical protein n=1 Tax=Shewanella algae TaxID=38313 RepID=UPI00313E5689